jgi:hypothetical protein
MTVAGRFSFKRVALVPLSKSDEDKLLTLTRAKMVYPLGEALGL